MLATNEAKFKEIFGRAGIEPRHIGGLAASGSGILKNKWPATRRFQFQACCNSAGRNNQMAAATAM
jgi:hypothetical protein